MSQSLIPFTQLEWQKTQESVAGQLAPSSALLYKRDIRALQKWITLENLSFIDLTYDDMVRYRAYLDEKYAKSTASRMLTVARRLLDEACFRGLIASNPAERVRGFHLDNESPRTALSEDQCIKMLKAIDRTTPKGKRDYALLSLMIRTGIRRAEVVALKVADLGMEQGFYIITIRHGKGDKRRMAKLKPELNMAIQDYLITRNEVTPDSWLFVGIGKNQKWRNEPLHMYGGLNYILKERAKSIGLDLTPHDLRATFATLALEGKAPLQKVQYAMGHADPRTTERYHLKKENLKDNATDYIHLDDE